MFRIVVLHKAVVGPLKVALNKGQQEVFQDLYVQSSIHGLVKNADVSRSPF